MTGVHVLVLDELGPDLDSVRHLCRGRLSQDSDGAHAWIANGAYAVVEMETLLKLGAHPAEKGGVRPFPGTHSP